MGHPLTDMIEAYSERLTERKKNLKNRIRFLDTLPQNRFSTYRGYFPNTIPYNETFQEMKDIDSLLHDIHEFLDCYIDDVCPMCGKIIGHDPYERHHISYYPEVTAQVHSECHREIHCTDSYSHLKLYFSGDSKDFYNGVKKPARWIESGIIKNEYKKIVLTALYRGTKPARDIRR